MAKILVTGATGHLGGGIVDFLLKSTPASDVAALARDPEKVRRFAERGVDVRQGDYFDRQSLSKAFAGVEKLFVVAAVTFTDRLAQHRNLIDAASEAGVKHIFYTGVQKPEGSAFRMSQVTEWEAETEKLIRGSGMHFTILRNTLYLDTLDFLLGDRVLTEGIRGPGGDVPAAMAARSDLAEASALLLQQDGHEGRTYTLTGAEGVTMNGLAKILSTIAKRPLSYEKISSAQLVKERTTASMPDFVLAFGAEWLEAIESGEFAQVTSDLERILGRRPVTAAQFLPKLFA